MKRKFKIKMKKVMIIAAASFALALCSCEAGKNSDNEKSLYKNGMDVVSLMDEMIHSEDYSRLMGNSDGISDMAESAYDCDYSSPSAVYKLEDVKDEMFEILLGDDLDFSKDLKKYLDLKLRSTMSARFNDQYGIEALAASSVYSASKTFVCEGLEETALYVYDFADSYPIIVVFAPGDNGSVSAGGYLIFDDDFKNSDTHDIGGLFENSSSFKDVKITKIEDLD